jgi:hypothetical protein
VIFQLFSSISLDNAWGLPKTRPKLESFCMANHVDFFTAATPKIEQFPRITPIFTAFYAIESLATGHIRPIASHTLRPLIIVQGADHAPATLSAPSSLPL